MDNLNMLYKGTFTLLMSWILSRMGVLVPVMALLCAVMAMDFITAWSAAKINGEPINSKSCSKGILKKTGYLIGVACGLVVDVLITILSEHIGMAGWYEPLFGLLVAVWLILNELVSILENLSKSGINLPPFLLKVIESLKIGIQQKGDSNNKEEDTHA